MDPQPFLQSAFISLVVIGMVIGLVIAPFLPGLVIIWLSVLAYGIYVGFSWLSGVVFALITILMIAGTLIDNVLMGAGARQHGASWWALGVGAVALIVGSIFLTPIGGLLVAAAAVFLVELWRLKEWRTALSSVKGIAIGWGSAAVARFFIGLMMIGLWFVWFQWIPK